MQVLLVSSLNLSQLLIGFGLGFSSTLVPQLEEGGEYSEREVAVIGRQC